MVSGDEKKAAENNRVGDLSPGELLVAGRERAGLTQEQVAKELYMTLTKVRALESDDYRHMGSDTFTRGYLRAYANLLKLDVVQLLASYDQHAQQNGLVEEALPRKQGGGSKPLWQFPLLIVAALLILWLISVWFFDNRKKPDYVMPTTVIAPLESSTVLNSVSSVQSSATLSANADEDLQAGLNVVIEDPANQNSSSSVDSEAVRSSDANSNLNAAVLDKITFTFTEECWLEVSDSRGDVLMTDLQSAGVSLTLQGKAPFDVKLGNAPAAKIELNNEKINIVPALGTNVLSLKVGKSRDE